MIFVDTISGFSGWSNGHCETASDAGSSTSVSSSSSTSTAGGHVCFVCHERCSRLGPCRVCNHFLCTSCEDTMASYKGGIYSARCSICKTRYPHASAEDERLARQLMQSEFEQYGRFSEVGGGDSRFSCDAMRCDAMRRLHCLAILPSLLTPSPRTPRNPWKSWRRCTGRSGKRMQSCNRGSSMRLGTLSSLSSFSSSARTVGLSHESAKPAFLSTREKLTRRRLDSPYDRPARRRQCRGQGPGLGSYGLHTPPDPSPEHDGPFARCEFWHRSGLGRREGGCTSYISLTHSSLTRDVPHAHAHTNNPQSPFAFLCWRQLVLYGSCCASVQDLQQQQQEQQQEQQQQQWRQEELEYRDPRGAWRWWWGRNAPSTIVPEAGDQVAAPAVALAAVPTPVGVVEAEV